jgi:hypothetical protein
MTRHLSPIKGKEVHHARLTPSARRSHKSAPFINKEATASRRAVPSLEVLCQS